ncbi:MAG: hypothetical protein COA83_08040 [Methylophaga sp.]|nr:MAG: hypothetical protein COA83_08040 [Methylophaga sp.]
MTNKKPLRQALKNMLKQNSLTEQQISQLQDIGHSSFSLRIWFTQRQHLIMLTSLVAGMALFLLVLNGYWFSGGNLDIQQRIALEVTANHLKIKNLDIETSSMNEVRNFFEGLDFPPYLSTRISARNLKLLGGRYCTLQGVIALQLRLQSPSGDIVTYYQSLYGSEHFGNTPDVGQGDRPSVIYKRGLEITIWKEGDVVSVLAEVARQANQLGAIGETH